jgi:hypothetical protein
MLDGCTVNDCSSCKLQFRGWRHQLPCLLLRCSPLPVLLPECMRVTPSHEPCCVACSLVASALFFH